MLPLNLRQLRPSWYTANLHKWVCAPKGAAFFWARPDRQKDLMPAAISHGNNTPRPRHTPFQDRFDWTGTFDPSPWFCVPEALRWMEQIYPGGWPAIREANHALAVQARRLLCERLQLEPPCPESMLGAMATLPLPDRFQNRPRPRGQKIDSEQLALYDRYGIEVPFIRMGKPERRFFRVSAQIYNRLEEYERLAEALADIG
jgi:isopenicillin-N epimerase